jgi:hypothetical protein
VAAEAAVTPQTAAASAVTVNASRGIRVLF